MRILFLGWNAYGDLLSYNGMLRFLLNHVDEIYFNIDNSKILEYALSLYADESRIKFCNKFESMSLIYNTDVFVLNSIQHTNHDLYLKNIIQKEDSTYFKDLINPNRFINGKNRLENYFKFDFNDTKNNLEYVDNASQFYVNLGLNPEIRYKNFYYKRNFNEEIELKNELLQKNNIGLKDDYIVICELPKSTNTWELSDKIHDEYKKNKNIININYCTNTPLNLISLVEGAKEVHLVEDSHTLFFYYLYMSGIKKIENINIHLYARNRKEHYYRMFLNPKPDTWKIIW